MMTELDEAYWTERYREGKLGWDLGDVSPPLREYIDGLEDTDLHILIPGAGNAYEWRHLIDNGFCNSEVVDISEAPLYVLKEAYPAYAGQLHHQDFFSLEGEYDMILEQTFFCALPPTQRPEYVLKMHELLVKDGLLVGVLFDREFDGGPPFGGNAREYEKLFSPHFDILKMEDCWNSAPPRLGHELFVILRKR